MYCQEFSQAKRFCLLRKNKPWSLKSAGLNVVGWRAWKPCRGCLQLHRNTGVQVRNLQTVRQSCISKLNPVPEWVGITHLGCCFRVGRVSQSILQPVFMTCLQDCWSLLHILPLAVLLCWPFREGNSVMVIKAMGNTEGLSCPCSPAPASGNTSSFLGIPRMQPEVWLFWLSWVEWDKDGFRGAAWKTENFPLSCTKRTPLVSVHGVHHVALGTDGGNGSCLRRETAAKKKSQEAETERWELGKGQRVFHVEKQGHGVCSLSYVLWCSTFLLSSLSIRKIAFVALCIWYSSWPEFERTLGNILCY